MEIDIKKYYELHDQSVQWINEIQFMTDEQFPVEEIRKKIKDILSEPEIRFCGLIDSDGQLVAGDFKDGVIPFETDKRRRQMFQ